MERIDCSVKTLFHALFVIVLSIIGLESPHVYLGRGVIVFHKMILAVFVLLALPFAEYAAYGNGGDLVRAAKKGDAERVKRVLDQGTKPNYEDPGWSALHWASVRGHLKVVELLVSAGRMSMLRRQQKLLLYILRRVGGMSG